MIRRNIIPLLRKMALDRHKMVFLSGPRQVGKTSLAKQVFTPLKHYFNWDDINFKKKWISSQEDIAREILSERDPRAVFDEIHKYPKWKNQIKGFYDLHGDKIKIIITGSAQFNTFRKGSDSLLGRFMHFHLHPISLGELTNESPISYSTFEKQIQSRLFPIEKSKPTLQDELFRYGGFPEPFLAKSDEIHRVWSKNRNELLIRQDLKDISSFLNHNQVEVLASLLPERVGSLLSIASLARDLDIAHTTVLRWMNALQTVYYHFDVKPYTHKIIRSLKKEGKIYLFDWSMVEEFSPRFENMVASHLQKLVDFYNDSGQADLNLGYLRNKEKEEVDFILTNKKRPLCTIEVKYSDLSLDKTFLKFRRSLDVPHFQIVFANGLSRNYVEMNAAVLSFDRFFSRLP
jgi:predicted AAA+ superfamily ATPase